MLENEKYWNSSAINEYNIMHYTVSYWILGEYGDREWVSNRRKGLIWLKHDIYRPGVPRWNPLGHQYTHNKRKKMKDKREK
jgi:hypothetical protein